jgi:NAD(P)-dependent dehydrogenase (short-subunit alcohol dehydrogenase family)
VAPYALFKGAMEVLTRYMAKEFGDMRIHVNAVSPSAIRTELGGGVSGEFEAALASQTALGRVAEPRGGRTCDRLLFTADGHWINAQTIEVSGGYVI